MPPHMPSAGRGAYRHGSQACRARFEGRSLSVDMTDVHSTIENVVVCQFGLTGHAINVRRARLITMARQGADLSEEIKAFPR